MINRKEHFERELYISSVKLRYISEFKEDVWKIPREEFREEISHYRQRLGDLLEMSHGFEKFFKDQITNDKKVITDLQQVAKEIEVPNDFHEDVEHMISSVVKKNSLHTLFKEFLDTFQNITKRFMDLPNELEDAECDKDDLKFLKSISFKQKMDQIKKLSEENEIHMEDFVSFLNDRKILPDHFAFSK